MTELTDHLGRHAVQLAEWAQAPENADAQVTLLVMAQHCTEAADEIERLRTDAERYQWLRHNAGAWEVSRDLSEWTRTETGEKFKPKIYFCAHGTGWGGRPLDEAVDAAMLLTPNA